MTVTPDMFHFHVINVKALSKVVFKISFRNEYALNIFLFELSQTQGTKNRACFVLRWDFCDTRWIMNELSLTIRPCRGNWVALSDCPEQSGELPTCLPPTVMSTCCLVSAVGESIIVFWSALQIYLCSLNFIPILPLASKSSNFIGF